MMRVGDVMTKRVVTIGESKTVREAARLMRRRGIGSLVVKRGAGIVGIVTERDLLAVIARGKRPEQVRLRTIMTRPVIVGEEEMGLHDAIKLMVVKNIKKLPVLRGKRLVGIVTLTDFARIGPLYHDLFQRALRDVPSPTKRKFEKFLPRREPPAEMYA